MKKFIAILCLSAITVLGYSQENMVTLSGGYSFANIDVSDEKATGWRINGLYEFNPNEGKLAHGVSLGFISLSASTSSGGVDTSDYKVSTLPVYYAPKLLFGNDNIKGFVKGAIGFQRSQFKRTGQFGEVEANAWGFYGGLGAGILFFINDKIFINAEYEFAWLSNSYYGGGIINSVMGGIGMKF